MQVYRFRLLFEEQEDFLRDIEIKPGQTFKDFHDVILQSVDIESNELASFFICDPGWSKEREITLIDMGLKVPDNDFDDDERKPASVPIPVMIMEDVKIKEVIDDPDEDAMLGELDKLIESGELEEEIDENYTTEPEW